MAMDVNVQAAAEAGDDGAMANENKTIKIAIVLLRQMVVTEVFCSIRVPLSQ